MSQWDQLSSELINNILINFQDDEKSLLSCQLVCKNWCDPAQRLLYKKIVITNPDQFLKFSQAIASFPHLFQTTKEIKLSFDLKTIPNGSKYIKGLEVGFPRILTHCQNLKTITMGKMGLSVINPLYQAIIDYQGEKLHLENIPFPSTLITEVEKYGEAVWKLRDTSLSLIIHNHRGVTLPFIDFKSTDESTTKLNMFSQLKNVEYHLAEMERASLPKTLYSIGSQDSINKVFIKSHYFSGHTPNTKYEKTKVYKNVKTLTLLYAVCTDSLVDYIVHTFSNLIQFTTKFSEYEPSDIPLNELQITSKTCSKFLNYLSSMKQYDVKEVRVDNLIGALDLYLPSIIKNCKLKISYDRDFSDRFHTNFTKGSTNDLYFHAIFASFPREYEDTLPHQLLIDKFGPDIQHLVLRISATRYDEYKHQHMNGHAIYYILESCPSLQSLCLESMSIQHPQRLTVNCNSLKKITFQSCELEKTILPQLSSQISQLQVLNWKESSCLFERCYTAIHMEDTTIENLVIQTNEKYSEFNYYVRVYIKSLDVTQLHHVHGHIKKAEQIFEEPDFLQDPIERMIRWAILIDIKCKSLQTLGVRMHKFNVAVTNMETKPHYTVGDNKDIVDKIL